MCKPFIQPEIIDQTTSIFFFSLFYPDSVWTFLLEIKYILHCYFLEYSFCTFMCRRYRLLCVECVKRVGFKGFNYFSFTLKGNIFLTSCPDVNSTRVCVVVLIVSAEISLLSSRQMSFVTVFKTTNIPSCCCFLSFEHFVLCSSRRETLRVSSLWSALAGLLGHDQAPPYSQWGLSLPVHGMPGVLQQPGLHAEAHKEPRGAGLPSRLEH